MMHTLLFLFFFNGLIYASANTRIIGGEPIDIVQAPYQLSLESYTELGSYSFRCGGVIIGPNYFLTAGHCVYAQDTNNLIVRVGSDIRGGGTPYDIKYITLHLNYTRHFSPFTHSDFDVAFGVTELPFSFGSTVKSINFTQTEPELNSTALVTGWGLTSLGGTLSPILLQNYLTIIDRESCEAEFNSPDIVISPTIICAVPVRDGTDPCNGDSGGPVVGNGSVIGLVSFGGPCEQEPHNVVAYTDIAYFNDWILDQISSIIEQ